MLGQGAASACFACGTQHKNISIAVNGVNNFSEPRAEEQRMQTANAAGRW